MDDFIIFLIALVIIGVSLWLFLMISLWLFWMINLAIFAVYGVGWGWAHLVLGGFAMAYRFYKSLTTHSGGSLF